MLHVLYCKKRCVWPICACVIANGFYSNGNSTTKKHTSNISVHSVAQKWLIWENVSFILALCLISYIFHHTLGFFSTAPTSPDVNNFLFVTCQINVIYTDYIISILKLFTDLDIQRACGAEWVSEWLVHWQISIFTPHPSDRKWCAIKAAAALRINPARNYIHGRWFSRGARLPPSSRKKKEARRVCCGCAHKHRRAFCWLLNGWSICKYLSEGNTHF